MGEVAESKDAPWYVAYPEAKSIATTMTRYDLLDMMNKGKKPGEDYLLVDLRRVDHEGGTIAGSINLPAQSLYPTIPTLYAMLKAAGVPLIIWYCGSSRGRGTRAAAWFADFVKDCNDDGVKIESTALLDGIKGWATAGEDYTSNMHEYNGEVWES